MNGGRWEGQVVDGQFHLRRYLGGSESSAVFLTEYGDGEPRQAAIKLVPADSENGSLQLARWELATALSHPHLIRLFRTGRCRLEGIDLLYVVMEYAEEDLSQVLPQRPLTPAEAQELLEPALDALAYLHGKGLAHGRLKPANFLAVGDQLKLSSDGVCRAGEPFGGSGQPGPYDPPEIRTRGATPAGDVWSFAATLVEALTQQLPLWEGTELEEPSLPGPLPPPFSDIARDCLNRDPGKRWTVEDIAACARGKVVGKPGRRAARRRYAVPVIAVCLVVAAILAGPKLLRRPPEPPAAAPIPSEPPKVPFERPSPSRTPVPARGIVQQVLPEVPQFARDTIQGMVRVSVRVAVDPAGNVVKATLTSPGPSKYFAGLSLVAARKWKFDPARAGAETEPVEWILRFEIGRETTNVFPQRAGR